tara:strand:+ start:832 stop:1284 length:453 start_codon:yes stop_codon:yes gene_type:complete
MSEWPSAKELKERFLNDIFDQQVFNLTSEQCVEYALACGELEPRYTDETHPDFQAPPTFPSSFRTSQHLPSEFPKLPGLGMHAGMAIHPRKPIRPGVDLTAKTYLYDIYEKTGRSGRMTFMVSRTEIFDPDGELLATADSRSVVRERPNQ